MNRPSCKPWVGTGHPSVMNLHEIPFGETLGAIHSTNIPTGPTGKSGPPQKVDPFFRNFSGWTKPIHWVLDQNFRKFWLNGSRVLVLKQYHHRYQYQSDSGTSLYQLGCHWGKWLQKTLITPWTCNSQVHESAKQTPTFDLLACESIRFFRFRRWPEIRLRVCRLSTCMIFLAFDKHMMQMCGTYFHGDSLYGKINRFWLQWNLY